MPNRGAVLAVKITGDASGAERAFRDTDDHVKGLSGRLDSLVGPATIALGAITAGAGFAAKAASDLAETQSKVGVVFGESAGEIQSWADTAAQSMGMSTQAALDAAGSFGTMFTAIGFTKDEAVGMSTGLTQLAADLASFHNVSGGAAQVTDMMSAAMRGEYDSIQALIPTINAAAVQNAALEASGKTSAAALTEQEKAAATMQLIMEGAGPAVGDFARTQDGAANSTRTAQAEMENAAAALGTALLPAVTLVTGAMQSMASWVTQNQTVAAALIGVIAALAAAVLAASVATRVFTAAQMAAKAAMVVVRAAQIAWTVATNAYALSAIAAGAATLFAYWPVLLIIAAIAALIAVVILIVKNWDKLVAAFKTGAAWIRGAFVAAWDAVIGAIQRVIGWFQRLWDKVKSVGDTIGNVLDKINPFNAAVGAAFAPVPTVATTRGAAPTSSGSGRMTITVNGVANPQIVARELATLIKGANVRTGWAGVATG